VYTLIEAGNPKTIIDPSFKKLLGLNFNWNCMILFRVIVRAVSVLESLTPVIRPGVMVTPRMSSFRSYMI
jgi:hypothetical protein